MELEGFGISLIGHAVYVHGDWIPWEFISGTPYNSRILITGEQLSSVELENSWNYIARPGVAKDWSILATIIRGCGGSILLAFHSSVGNIPPGFYTFLDNILLDGKTVVSRVWLQCTPHSVPDAVFFPPNGMDGSFEIVSRLPSRNNHGPFTVSAEDWKTYIGVTGSANLGLVVSDIGETNWSIFWHKMEDSRPVSSVAAARKGLSLIKIGTMLIEKNSA